MFRQKNEQLLGSIHRLRQASACRARSIWSITAGVPCQPDCYWVGSLDFTFLGNQGGFPRNPQKAKLFAEGSASEGPKGLTFDIQGFQGFKRAFASKEIQPTELRSALISACAFAGPPSLVGPK